VISRYPSPDTQRLLDELAKPPRLWERWRPSAAKIHLLRQIGERDEPAAIPRILTFALSHEPATRTEAAKAIERLLQQVPMVDLPILDEVLRRRYYGMDALPWGRPLESLDLNRFAPLGKLSVPLLAVATCNWNGYVRQSAIEWLGRAQDVRALPFLVLRLNDWVPEVRGTAAAALAAWIRPDRAHEFATVLPLVARLEEKTRGSHAVLLTSVRALLAREECQNVLLASVASPDIRVRRFAFGAALEAPSAELVRLLERALSDPDTSIRLWAAQAVSSRPTDRSLLGAIQLMEHDHLMPVRREALRWHLRQSGDAREAALEAALLDPHPSMAAEARYHLGESSPRDFAAFYRRVLASAEGRALVGALTGLGETGTASDGSLLQFYLSHTSPRVRATALRAFTKIRPEAPSDLFLAALHDTSSRVSGTARRIFPRSRALAARAQLMEAFEQGAERHVRVNAFWLLTRLDHWDALPLLLQALEHPDPRVARAAPRHLERWFADSSRYYVVPRQAQLSAIHEALDNYGQRLRSDWKKLLLFILKSLGEPSR
jgi:HEAT repeat protein